MTNIYILFYLLLIRSSHSLPSLPSNAIKIQSHIIHVKQQQPLTFIIENSSEIFEKVPGLTTQFYHTQPLLYKIRFDGVCTTYSGVWTRAFVRLMVDDSLLYGFQLTPNTVDRWKSISGATSLTDVDQIGGGSSLTIPTSELTCSKTDFIYLQPGLHTLDVGARGDGTATPSMSVRGGQLTIELIQADQQAEPMNVSMANPLGR
ncbi:unnamed protein product [Didymodactylos carnosus]|uniref:Uncharacterized protein n=2 Tax=Didymodactylos carnosus TaxID=1234261 RepID=A0A8S2DXA1_9BILA|nr:unnamed protein product [Didymodactylos carnosus]CAF3823655.1 unnamed protein product [Didymodactylos carnosus]